MKFGKEYKDTATGFRGVCVGVAHYMDGTTQAQLAAMNGDVPTTQWIGGERLQEIQSTRAGFVAPEHPEGK